jgi:hypothetical protein
MKTTIEVDLKWWCFIQNNTGGKFKINDLAAHYVFIQSTSLGAAEYYGVSKGILDNSNSCSCCGDRWNGVDSEKGFDIPTVFDTPLSEYKDFGRGSEARLHYFDGKFEKIKVPSNFDKVLLNPTEQIY